MTDDNLLTFEEELNILKMLRQLTEAGKIEWLRGENNVRPDRRTTATPDRSFGFVIQSFDQDGERPYELIVLRSLGGRTKAIADIKMVAADEGGNAEINSLLEDLYEKAHQRQPSEEVLVKDLFDTLNRLGQEP